MPSLFKRSWTVALLVALLIGAGLWSCGGEPLVIVTLVGMPAAATHVTIQTALDGTPGQDQTLPATATQFALRFPSGDSGNLAINVAALDDSQTKLAVGSTTVQLPSGVPSYISVSIVLSPAASVSVVLQYGRARITSNPPGIDCSEFNPAGCQASFGYDASVTLTVQPDPHTVGWSWAGACAGTQDCALVVDRPRQAILRVAEVVCSDTGWCWENPLPQGNSLRAAWGSATDDVWAVGSLGVLLHWNGQQWGGVRGGWSTDLAAVWGSSASDVWAVGSGGRIFHWDGHQLSAVDSGTAADLTGVWGSAANDVWAVGDGGTTLRWDGAGWRASASGTTMNLTAAWGSSASDVWAVGIGGTLLHFDGMSWTAAVSGTMANLASVWGSSSSDVWTVGAGGVIVHFTGGAWKSVPSGTTSNLYAVWGSSATDLWAAGNGGVALHYNGTTFGSAAPATSPYQLNALWGSSGTDLWAVGSLGTILKIVCNTLPAHTYIEGRPRPLGGRQFKHKQRRRHFLLVREYFLVASSYLQFESMAAVQFQGGASVKKNPILAAILNFLLFGGGTLYVGRRVGVGLALTVGGSLAQGAEIIISPPVRNLAPSIWPFLIGGLVIMKVALAVDGYREAKEAA